MGAIRSSARALDELIYSKILKDEWEDLEKETCQNFARGKCKLGDKCPRSHSKSGHGRSGKNKDKKQPSKIPCRHFLRGRCNLGDKCKFSHKGKPKATSGSNRDNKHNPLNRCKADLSDKKCPFGMKCWHAHRSSVNQRKDADKDISDKVAKAKQVCRCCARKGHTAKECNKLKAHLQDIKDAVGYTGNIAWFDDNNIAKRCQDLSKKPRMETNDVREAANKKKARNRLS